MHVICTVRTRYIQVLVPCTRYKRTSTVGSDHTATGITV